MSLASCRSCGLAATAAMPCRSTSAMRTPDENCARKHLARHSTIRCQRVVSGRRAMSRSLAVWPSSGRPSGPQAQSGRPGCRDHPCPEHQAIHATDPRLRRSALAVQHRSGRPQPQCHASIVVCPGKPPMCSRRQARPDHLHWDGSVHDAMPACESRPTTSAQPKEPALRTQRMTLTNTVTAGEFFSFFRFLRFR